MLRRCVGVVALVACTHPGGGGGHARSPDYDPFCATDPKKPQAYAYTDQDSAEKDGCSAKRVYRGIEDPKTGAVHDDEFVTYCCPKRK